MIVCWGECDIRQEPQRIPGRRIEPVHRPARCLEPRWDADPGQRPRPPESHRRREANGLRPGRYSNRGHSCRGCLYRWSSSLLRRRGAFAMRVAMVGLAHRPQPALAGSVARPRPMTPVRFAHHGGEPLEQVAIGGGRMGVHRRALRVSRSIELETHASRHRLPGQRLALITKLTAHGEQSS